MVGIVWAGRGYGLTGISAGSLSRPRGNGGRLSKGYGRACGFARDGWYGAIGGRARGFGTNCFCAYSGGSGGGSSSRGAERHLAERRGYGRALLC